MARWPLRELLLALVETLKTEALETYRWELQIYALQAPWAEEGKLKPPPLPDILKPRS